MPLAQKRTKKGLEPPSWWNERPEIEPDYQWVYEAFTVLHSHRPSGGFGVSPLQISDIAVCLDLTGVRDALNRETAFKLISALDKAYMEWSLSRGHDKRGDAKTHD